MSQEALNFRLVSAGILVTDTLPSHITREFMQFERERKTLLTGHLAITLELLLVCTLRIHTVQNYCIKLVGSSR
jgi:hypothetical protein